MSHDGILSGPMDIEAPKRRGPSAKVVNVELGMALTHRGDRITGSVLRYVPGQMLVLRDRSGKDHSYKPRDGAFLIGDQPVALRQLVKSDIEVVASETASGSIDIGPIQARVARPSRIYVEGIHDAELIEKVWGDDLRIEGVVVEQIAGADDLAALVRSFQPREGRRLGVLLDHLVEGSKESRIAAEVNDPNVLICGHPYVDVWAAVKPTVVGRDSWPEIPMGTPWKEGIMAELGVSEHSSVFWKQLLAGVNNYKDLQTPLITAVEQLIDFVCEA